MHTPTLVSTAFTAAVLFAGHTQAAPIRRGSVVDDDIAPRSGPPSRRGSTTEELSASRRGSIADDIMASRRRSIVADPSDLARRGSAPSPMDIANARRRSSVVDMGSPSRRSSLAAPPQDGAGSRRRSVADGALPVPGTPEESRRSSVANDIFAARKRSLIDSAQPMRRSSLANPADILNARKRSMTPSMPGAPVPVERRSISGPAQVNPASLPNRKAFVAEPEEMHERRDSEPSQVSPFNLPNRKAFIAAPQVRAASEHQRRGAAPPQVAPASLPNRKAFIAPQAEDLDKRDEVAPKVLPSKLPNRKAFIAPEEDTDETQIKIAMADIPPSFSTYSFPATPAAEKRDFDPFLLPNRKAFIHADQAALDGAGAKIGVKPYTFPPAPNVARRTFDPASLPNRKAFIHPDELKIEDLSVEERQEDAPAPPPAEAIRRARRSLGPASLPNRKAFIATPAVEDIADVEVQELEEDVPPPPSAEALRRARRSLDPASLPNRKAFIAAPAVEDISDAEGQETAEDAPAPPSAEALRRARRSLDPASLPNRKAFIAAPAVEDIADVDTEHVDAVQAAEDAAEQSATQAASEAGTAIPLFKRAGAPLTTDGIVDMDKAQAHLDHINVKYQKGAIAYQKRTGQPLFDSKLLSDEELAEKEEHLAKRQESLGLNRGSRRAGVSLKSYNSDLLWAGPVSIGTPAQNFILDFDTGSADTWVPSAACDSAACSSHHKYDPAKSSTSKLQDGELDIEYGDGSATKGKVYTDKVTVGGVTATNQAIGVATEMSNSFADDPQDGIMGMGYESISTLKEKPFFQSLMSEGTVAKPQFSFSLNSGSGSELYLGGANSNKYSGDVEWHDVLSESYWVLEGDAYVDNNKANQDFYAIIDTGTTVVVAPPAEAEEFWNKVPGSEPYAGGYYTFPCDSVPDVSFSFGGQKWEMDADTLNLGSTASGSQRCVGSVVGMDVGVNAWIMGDSFLKNVYTTFDFDKNAVGFAEKKDGKQQEE